MSKTVEARVSISTDPRVAHIGRYFVDVRDTTEGANRQMTTRVTNDPIAFVKELTTMGEQVGVQVTMIDQTGGELTVAPAPIDTRAVEVIREALPGEVCNNVHVIAVGDWTDSYPCGQPAELVFRSRENGSESIYQLCAECGEPEKQAVRAQVGGDAILP